MSGLSLKNISHAFVNNQVVKDVSLEVRQGELVCLLGPSGCGKTTLLRIAAGLEKIQIGQVCIEGKIVADPEKGINHPPEKRGVGLMFQDYALFPHLSVKNNIIFGIEYDDQQRINWSNQALEKIGLKHHAHEYPHTLSGGQQQRVALLRAIAPRPKILLLDEPFSSLDMTSRLQIRNQTLDILKQTNIATLMVTHDPEEAMYMADQILVMNEGRIIQVGTPDELYYKPNNAIVAGFLGPINKLITFVENGKAITPLGSFIAPNFNEGDKVQVLIRPECINLSDANESKENKIFEVVTSRMIGGDSLINFNVPGTNGKQSIQARMSDDFQPAIGSYIKTEVNDKDVYIYPI